MSKIINKGKTLTEHARLVIEAKSQKNEQKKYKIYFICTKKYHNKHKSRVKKFKNLLKSDKKIKKR